MNSKNPVIICGCHGGGTSFVTKILRMNGLDAGDSGPLNVRKFHESESMKNINRFMIREMGITEKLEGFTEVWGSGRSNNVVREYNNFINNQTNIEHIIDQSKKMMKLDLFNMNTVWGWKDPRNSVTAFLWSKIFVQPKFLVISKDNDRKPSKTDSGKFFKEIATDEVIKFYTDHIRFKDYGVSKQLHFDSFVSDYNYFNEIMEWLGLNKLNESEYKLILEKSKYEK